MGSSNLFLNIYTVMGCTQVTGMEDIFVFDGGAVAVDTNGSIGTTNQKAHVSLKSLHVQDKGTFQMKTYTTQNQFTMEATNITVRLTVKIV